MTDRKISEQNMETLLKHGLETKNDKGQTALLLACENGSFEKARELIGKGANVNVRDNNGRTPIMIACEKGQTDLLIFLLSNGAEASVLVNSTLLTREFLKEHPELVKFLVNGGDKAETLSAAPAFLFSSQAADFKAVSEYLASGGNADAVNAAGQTALMLTAANDDAKCVELLIGNGANVNLRDKDGRTALMYAVQKGCDKAGELLLKNKANPNLQDKDGKTALMFAAEQGKLTSTEMLVKYEADITLTDKNGQNALMIAAAEGQTDIVRFLAEDCREEKAKDAANRQQDTPGNNKPRPAYAVKKAVDLNRRQYRPDARRPQRTCGNVSNSRPAKIRRFYRNEPCRTKHRRHYQSKQRQSSEKTAGRKRRNQTSDDGEKTSRRPQSRTALMQNPPKSGNPKKSTGLPCRGKPAANGRQPFELPDKRRRIRRQTNNPLKTYRAFGRTFFRQGKKITHQSPAPL